MELKQIPAGIMTTDLAEIFQPENSTSFVLNGILEEGSGGKLRAEPSFDVVENFPNASTVIGHVLLPDNSVVLFVTNNDAYHALIRTRVSTLDPTRVQFEEIIEDSCLNFNTKYPIKAETRVLRGCENVVYWVDGINEDRYINIDRLEDFLDNGVLSCNAIKLNPDFRPADVVSVDIKDGGGPGIEVGSYQFCFAYEDAAGVLTDYFGFTNPVNIIYGSYDSIDALGDQNIIAGFAAEVGGKPKTNKTVELTLQNIDTKFSYVRVYCIRYTNGDLTPVVNYVGRIQISDPELKYLFTSYSGTEQITLGDVAVSKARYKSAKEIEQTQNRLLRANLISEYRDWAAFQRYANDVRVNYNIFYTPVDSVDVFSTDSRGYIPDEVYALGIKWLFEDGTESPVFHIPGREKNKTAAGLPISDANDPDTHSRLAPYPGEGWDSTVYNPMPVDANFIVTGERWQIYNTSFNGTREMAYYECAQQYPDIKDCDGVPIFPHTESSPGVYVMDQIRHHRMPDLHQTEGLYDSITNSYRQIGLDISNVAIPSGVVGWKILRAQRDEFNKTVLDSGIMYKSSYYEPSGGPVWGLPNFHFQRTRFHSGSPNPSGAGEAFWYPTASENGETLSLSGPGSPDTSKYYTSPYYCFHGVKSKFDKAFSGADHVKYEGTVSGAIEDFTIQSDDVGFGEGLTASNHEVQAYRCFHRTYARLPNSPVSTNGVITFEKTVQYGTSTNLPDGTTFPNHTAQEITVLGGSNLFTDNGVYTDSIAEANYVALKRLNFNCYSDFATLPYFDTSSRYHNQPNDSILGGDCFVGKLWFRQTTDAIRKQLIGVEYGYLRNLTGFFAYSDIPFNMRVEGEGINGNKVYKSNGDTLNFMWLEYSVYPDTYDQDKPKVMLSNYYSYNPDYGVNNSSRKYFMLPFSWKYCSDCGEKYPNRIIYSDIGRDETIVDGYVNYGSNNYVDIPSHTGEIKDIFVLANDVYVATPKSVFKIGTGTKQIVLTDETVQIGTGEFLSLPPEDVLYVESGYAGCNSRFASVKTPFGVFYADEMSGEVYHVSSGAKAISRRGMHRFFRDNLRIKFPTYVESAGGKYGYVDSVPDFRFVGLYMFYDPKHERVIIHKRDFEPRYPIIVTGSEVGKILYNQAAGRFFMDSINETFFDNKDHFINRSFTMSFSPKHDGWVSFHSYSPAYSFFDSEHMYITRPHNYDTFLLGSKQLFRQGTSGVCNFFEYKAPFIVEMVFKNPSNMYILDNIGWYTDAFSLYADGQRLDSNLTTFNKLTVYNSYQSTGTMTLQARTSAYQNVNPSFTLNNQFIVKTDREWNIGRLRDKVDSNNEKINSSDWTDIQSQFNNIGLQGYIDKVEKSTNIIAPNQYNAILLRDRWHKARFQYDGTVHLVLDIVSTSIKNSAR